MVDMQHALGEGHSDWAPVLGRFAEHFRVVAGDLRGHRSPNCSMVTIPAGHLVHTTQAEDFTEEVLGWYSRTPSP